MSLLKPLHRPLKGTVSQKMWILIKKVYILYFCKKKLLCVFRLKGERVPIDLCSLDLEYVTIGTFLLFERVLIDRAGSDRPMFIGSRVRDNWDISIFLFFYLLSR